MAYRKAEALCEKLNEDKEQFYVLHGFWVYHFVRMEPNLYRNVAAKLINLATRVNDPSLLFAAHANSCVGDLHLAQLQSAERHFQKAWSLPYGPDDDRQFVSRSCVPFGIICGGISAWLFWLQGRFREAVELSQASISGEEALAVPQFSVQTWLFAAMHYYMRREPVAAYHLASLTVEYASRHDLSFYLALGTVVQCWAKASLDSDNLHSGEKNELAGTMLHIVNALRAKGVQLCIPHLLSMLAEVHLQLGQVDDARHHFEDALSTCRTTGERMWESEILRQLAFARTHDNAVQPTMAEPLIIEAIQVARAQNAKSLELRSLVSFMKLLRSERRFEDMESVATNMEELLATFGNEEDSVDLQEAHEMLNDCKQEA